MSALLIAPASERRDEQCEEPETIGDGRVNPIAYIAVILCAAVALFVWNRIPAGIVGMMTALALWACGILSLNQALAGFGDPAVIFIASLFVVSTSLDMTGVTAWAGQLLIRGAGQEGLNRLLLLTMTLVAVLTALISGNGAVAALLPVVVVMAVRLNRYSSQLLMPLAFASHAGSKLALTGSAINVLASDAADDAGVGGFGFFEFALAGVPLLVGTLVIIIALGKRLLPERNGASMPADLSRHARTLVEQYGLKDGLHQMRVRASSPLIGSPTLKLDLDPYGNLEVVALLDGITGGPLLRPSVEQGDYLLVRGDVDTVAETAAKAHLAIRESSPPLASDEMLFNRSSGLAEVVIPPRSGLVGKTVFPGMATDSGDLIILAVQRSGGAVTAREVSNRAGATPLQVGDTMLLQGTWKALDLHLDDPDVLVVGSPELVRRQAVPMGPGARKAVVILLVMVLLLATGIVPPAVAGLLAAGAIILTGIMTVEQSYQAVSWTTVVLVGAMIPLSTAMLETGAAELMAEQLVRLAGDSGPIMLLTGIFVLAAILGQLISNTATALIIIPIGVAAATGMDVSPRPVLMSIAIAAGASFLTPIATATNLMVMAPGGYAFSDYWKLGLPVLLWFYVISVFLVPLIWRF